MIGGLKRRLSRGDRDPWKADLELRPEFDNPPEGHESSTASPEGAKFERIPTSHDVAMRDYCKEVVQDAIQHGGNHQGMQISIPWLRMILAGLEMRPIPPEAMWEGESISKRGRETDYGIPLFEDLFPSERSTRSIST